jgi:hypothetical protein
MIYLISNYDIIYFVQYKTQWVADWLFGAVNGLLDSKKSSNSPSALL